MTRHHEIREGTSVRYGGDLPGGCDSTGTVIEVTPDASGDQIVTVEFDCGLTQDIPASELALA